ncbi:hypothetical protein JW905_09250, partial [bacterium]|nr:hypothetical protein [candidate division CSSED10-310 bacterium]
MTTNKRSIVIVLPCVLFILKMQAGCLANDLLLEGFESIACEWQCNGLWHQLDGRSPAAARHGGSGAMAYRDEHAGTYDLGHAHRNDLYSPAITIQENVHINLAFWEWVSSDGTCDTRRVYVFANDRIDWMPIYQSIITRPRWERVELDLGSYSPGDVLQVRFQFDTVNNQNNQFQGWVLDDVHMFSVLPTPTPFPTITPLPVPAMTGGGAAVMIIVMSLVVLIIVRIRIRNIVVMALLVGALLYTISGSVVTSAATPPLTGFFLDDAGVERSRYYYVDCTNEEGPWDGSGEFPFQTIGDALQYAVYGDFVWVLPCTYAETIQIPAGVAVMAAEPRQAVLEAGTGHATTVIAEGESLLAWFTINHVSAVGIQCDEDDAIIFDNDIAG